MTKLFNLSDSIVVLISYQSPKPAWLLDVNLHQMETIVTQSLKDLQSPRKITTKQNKTKKTIKSAKDARSSLHTLTFRFYQKLPKNHQTYNKAYLLEMLLHCEDRQNSREHGLRCQTTGKNYNA